MRFFTEVLNDNAGAVDDLAGVAITVNGAYKETLVSLAYEKEAKKGFNLKGKATYRDRPIHQGACHRGP